MDFGALPPEVNSGRMYVGAGSGPLLAAAAAWDALGAELYSFAAAYTSTIAGLTVGSWLGPAATSMSVVPGITDAAAEHLLCDGAGPRHDAGRLHLRAV